MTSDPKDHARSASGETLWQPIETAPLDGTVVDLHSGHHRYADCFWGRADHHCGEAGQYCDSEWHSQPPGWIDANFNQSLEIDPTHWMPQPGAPT